MNTIKDNVTSGTTNVVNTVKGVTSDITNIKFYKSPVFFVWLFYITSLTIFYMTLENSTKNNYIFSDKFRDDKGDIKWIDILKYPHGLSTVPNIIKSMFTGPIPLYLLFFTMLFTSVINVTNGNVQPYFYGIMVSYFILFVIFMIHVLTINKFIEPKNIDISTNMKKDKNVTYGSLYRTQWILLLFLSPLYALMVLYIARKL